MSAEHCVKYGATEAFTTTNYYITTTPADEWRVVITGNCSPDLMSHGRIIPSIDGILAGHLAQQAGLTRPEVIAVVLYTGPMVRVPRFHPSPRWSNIDDISVCSV
jgi:hypothetical protein